MISDAVYPRDLEALLTKLPNLTPSDQSLIQNAYRLSQKAHHGQKRKSGEPYFTHCVAVAGILADMKLDAETISAGLLHDTIEDTDITFEQLRSEFGVDVARMVEGVTKLTNLPIQNFKPEQLKHSKRTSVINKEMEYFRKVLLTLNDDVRVVLIKLADRLHNMRTLGFMPRDKQMRIAKETMEIYAPLANRLGIWQIKWELEDLSFRYLEPDAYREISNSLAERREIREAYVEQVAKTLREELANHGITTAAITGRPKHIYSIYRKMVKKQVPLENIYDVRAVRVIVDTLPQCYLVLGLVHSLWRPIPGEFDDYIAAPKDNFYRSLHTAVLDAQGKTLEVQIRTWEMHEDAEYGIAAHWRYKEGTSRHNDEAFEKRLNYLRSLMEAGTDVSDDAEKFVDTMKSEVFEDRVYAFTPQGDVIDLPVGATPIDFAYYIHTEIGHRCRGAKIHGQLKGLDYQLKTGDQVEIITAKRGGPSMDWLNADLGYVKTTRARAKIRHWFRQLNRDKHISMGRDVLERELKRLGVLDKLSFETVAVLFDFDKLDDFLAAIGVGDISSTAITNKVLEDERRKQQEAESETKLWNPKPLAQASTDVSNGVSIMGTSGLLVNISKCCSPMPGDPIVGYVTRGRGVTVHRKDCTNILSLPDRERLLDVSWGATSKEQRYTVPIEVIAHDRKGLLRDISTLISDEGINIASVNVVTRQQLATLYIDLQISDNRQLTRILPRIETVADVIEARRKNMA